MEGDLQLAREIQLAMLPAEFPALAPGATGRKLALRFGQRFESAGVVSGDFFHVLKISETAVGIFICDVMGHGVRSAFVTAVLRALVEEMRAQGNDPAALLSRLNAELITILKPMESPLYATAFYLVVDAAAGTIRFAKAGHPAPMRLQRATGEVRRLQCEAGKGGPALGLLSDAAYGNCEQSLAPGDLILLFTDGIYEVFDAAGNEFGPESVAAFLTRHRQQPLEALLDGLVAAARNFSPDRNFEDDVCLIALEALNE
jgi:serine phosphatase RsbU (regulator of sigma subunit)